MTPEQILERERNRALPVAVAAFGGIALIVIATVLSSGAPSIRADPAEYLEYFPDHRGALLTAQILQGAGTLFLILPLFYLFQAADARSDRMRTALIGITVAGPLFLGLGAVLQWVGVDAAVPHFGSTPQGKDVDDYARDVLGDQAAYNASAGLGFAGSLGLVVGMFYTSLNAMRVGLLTRLWGTLGMALGVSVLLPTSLVGLVIFFLAIGFLILGIWPGARPPAWETGEAIPWPKGGEEPQASGGPDSGEEPALPPGVADDDQPAEDESPAARQAPRKRKRRSQ